MATINVDEATRNDLRKFCQKHHLTQGDFVKHALAYFRKSGIDPSDPPESVKEELNKIEKRISQSIAFQKTFEKEKLSPLINDIIEVTQRLKAFDPSNSLNHISVSLKELRAITHKLIISIAGGLLGRNVDYKLKAEELAKAEQWREFYTLKQLKQDNLVSKQEMASSINELNAKYNNLLGLINDMADAMAASDKNFRKNFRPE